MLRKNIASSVSFHFSILFSPVPQCQTAAVFPISPHPSFQGFLSFPLSKNFCHHLSVFPHRSSVHFISLTRCTALIIQWLEKDLDLAEPAKERSVTQSHMLSFTDDHIHLTALLFSICLMETADVLMKSLIIFQDPAYFFKGWNLNVRASVSCTERCCGSLLGSDIRGCSFILAAVC